jgi:uncharacterized membrane protein
MDFALRPMAIVTRLRTRTRITIWLLGAVSAVQLLLTLTLAMKLNLWVDEAYSLHTTDGGTLRALHEAIRYELQAPLYFIVLQLWRQLDHSVFSGRLFSVLCALVSVWLTALIACRYVARKDDGRPHPIWPAVWVAFNPFVIWAAVELRLYAFALALSALLLLLFYEGYLAPTTRRAARWAYVAVAVAAVYTQYYLAFMLVGQACSLIVLRRFQMFRRFAMQAAVVVVALVPLAVIVRLEMTTLRGTISALSVPRTSLFSFIWSISDWFVPSTSHRALWIAGALILGATAAVAAARKRRVDDGSVAIFTIAVVVTTAFIAVAHFSAIPLELPRHTVALFLPLELGAFALIAGLRRPARTVALAGATLLFIALDVRALHAEYAYGAKYGDWARIAGYIERNESPGEPILVFRAANVLPLRYYYRGVNVLVPLPYPAGYAEISATSRRLHEPGDITRSLVAAHASASPRRLWLAITDQCDDGRPPDCRALQRFIAENRFTAVRQARFFHGEAWLFQR